ncbi:hypothetical protein JCM8547_003470 [Rhodosporidiobolus lusitaniae]
MASNGGAGRAVSPTNSTSSRQSSRSHGPVSTSNLESTITRLLVATKQLLEGLAKWSRGEVNEEAISAIYVKLGNDFNVACAAFARENISMNELLSVPSDLRICLETCLSDTPSQSTLERHLPQVRQIIIGLLHGLREKQRLYRDGVAARRAREKAAGGAPGGAGGPPGAAQANGSAVPPQQQQHQQPHLPTSGVPLTPGSASRSRDELRRFVTHAQQAAPPASTSSYDDVSGPNGGPRPRHSDGSVTSSSRRSATEGGGGTSGDPRLSAALSSRFSANGPQRGGSLRERGSERESNRSSRSTLEDIGFMPPPSIPRSNSGTSLADSAVSGTSRPLRSRSPPPPARTREEIPRTPTMDSFSQPSTSAFPGSPPSIPIPSTIIRPPSVASSHSVNSDPSAPHPPPPPQAQSAQLEALKTSDHLSRRASKRYSAYAIQKMTSPVPSGGQGGTSPSSPGGGGGGEGGSPRSDKLKSRDFAGFSPGGGGGEPRRSKSDRQSTRPGGGLGSRAPPVPGIPRSWSSQQNLRGAGGAGGAGGSPIIEEDEERSERGSSPEIERKRAGGPPSFAPPPPPPPVTRSGSAPTLSSSQTASTTPTLPYSSSAGAPAYPSHLGAPAPSSSSARRSPSPALPPVPSDAGTSPSPSLALSPPPAAPPSFSPPSPPTSPPSSSDTPSRIFLRLGPSVRRAVLPSPGPPADVQVLRQLFVERFGYHPQGAEGWPDVYVQDERTGVRFELEEMEDVKEGTVVCLNIDTVEQVKHHIDSGLSSLAQDIKELRATVTAMRRLSVGPPSSSAHPLSASPSLGGGLLSPRPDEHSASSGMRPSPSQKQFEQAAEKVLRMRRLGSTTSVAVPQGEGLEEEDEGKERGAEERKEDEPAAAAPAPAATAPAGAEPFSPTTSIAPIVDTLKSQHAEVQNLRREIGVLRQVYVDFTSQTKSMFAGLRVQTSHLHGLAQSKLSTDRTFVEAGTAKLDSESTDLVVRVDELQDTIEQLRADTVRGVKPRPQQLSETASALRKAVEQRGKLDAWLKEVKPSWSQMWSVELSKILGEQKAVETQETLLGELDEDLQDAEKVLRNIQAVAKQLKPSSSASSVPRPPPRELGGSTDHQEGLSTVLMEVKALNPDPTRRLEAIERAEREREKQLAAGGTDEFKAELGEFVGSGKLKKSGGVEETERLRQKRSEAVLRAMFSQG